MANEEQLAILKQGVDVWNAWKRKHPALKIDLREADLSGVNLSQAILVGVDLIEAKLKTTDLSDANLIRANLSLADFDDANLKRARLNEAKLWKADLNGADLRNADLQDAELVEASLMRTNLSEASLKGANLREADLWDANLKDADLWNANFKDANLSKTDLRGANLLISDFNAAVLVDTNFKYASFGNTSFVNVDLSETIGLDFAKHLGPSHISTDTIQRSKGDIPVEFLRGCGLNDWEIELVNLYGSDLSNDEINKILYRIYDLRASQAIQISSIFFSYSRADDKFVEKIRKRFTEMGVRYWNDTHEMKAGRREKQIDRAIRQNPMVLLVLSKHSLKSDWVEHEVRLAQDLQKELGRDTLCPIALDDSWNSSRWPKRVMEQVMEYSILDFSEWEDNVKFEGMFRKLIDGLELFYKG